MQFHRCQTQGRHQSKTIASRLSHRTAPSTSAPDHPGSPVQLLDFVQAIETAIGIDAQKIFMDIQPGDVPGTWAEAGLLKSLTGEAPVTPIETGIQAFVDWYREYYKV